MSTTSDRRELGIAHARMLRHFGPLEWWPARTPFEIIVGAVLTQNTAWTRVVPAIDDLRRAGLLDPVRLDAVPEEEIADRVRPAGTFRVKAGYLRAVTKWLVEGYGGDVALALTGETSAKRRELLAIRGVGRETADSILLYAGGHAIFVVDAYTRRVFSRHGYLDPDADYDAIRGWFEARFPRDPATLGELHAQIVNTGKRYCRPRRPRCFACPLEFLFRMRGGPRPAGPERGEA